MVKFWIGTPAGIYWCKAKGETLARLIGDFQHGEDRGVVLFSGQDDSDILVRFDQIVSIRPQKNILTVEVTSS